MSFLLKISLAKLHQKPYLSNEYMASEKNIEEQEKNFRMGYERRAISRRVRVMVNPIGLQKKDAVLNPSMIHFHNIKTIKCY